MSSIRAYAINRDAPPVVIELIDQTRLYGGGLKYKHVVTGSIGSNAVSLVQRNYEQYYVDAWNDFRGTGLPIVPSLRTADINGEKSLLVTDVKADGSELYGKGLRSVLTYDERRERQPAARVDQIFQELTSPQRIVDIETEVLEYAKLADQNGLVLPTDGDAFELQVRPGGTWNLIITDLTWAGNPDREHMASWRRNFPESFDNRLLAHDFLENLRAIRSML